ncbi:unnamed protein product [Pylaiella littoralis]
MTTSEILAEWWYHGPPIMAGWRLCSSSSCLLRANPSEKKREPGEPENIRWVGTPHGSMEHTTYTGKLCGASLDNNATCYSYQVKGSANTSVRPHLLLLGDVSLRAVIGREEWFCLLGET